jgi:hypothetical protein
VRIVRWTSRAAQVVAPLVAMVIEALTPIIAELGGLAYGLAARYREHRAARQRRHTRPSAPTVAPSITRASPSPVSASRAERRTSATTYTASSETSTDPYRTP